MKTILRIILVIPVLAGQAAAEPIKCVVGGKTFYTDDPASCPQGSQQPIGGHVTIMAFPKTRDAQQDSLSPMLHMPSWFDSLTLPDGLSKEDLLTGWKTIIDARQRGFWQSPTAPQDDAE